MMSVKIRVLTNDLHMEYEQLLQNSPIAMFNHSLGYRDLIRRITNGTEDRYLCAFLGGRLVAALPLFISHSDCGAVVNSLPFYGSHGGIIYGDGMNEGVASALFQELDSICREVGALSCTVVEPPLEENKSIYEQFGAHQFDERISQITRLPLYDERADIRESLFRIFHQKTRNMVRKGERMGFEVSHDGAPETVKVLHSMHKENIVSIGGVPKPLSVFEAIGDSFRYDEDYRIYFARKEGKIVSTLLLFYFKDMVEYFTPATLANYRNEQPMSLLIYIAMRDAVVERGSRLWNWGGTWLSQKGVYRFKSRWGAVDRRYRYHIRIWREFDKDPEERKHLLEQHPFFYLFPFGDEQ